MPYERLRMWALDPSLLFRIGNYRLRQRDSERARQLTFSESSRGKLDNRFLRGALANEKNASGSIGRANRKPCSTSQPCLTRKSACSLVSTPSATVFKHSPLARPIVARTIDAVASLVVSSATKVRSIFRVSSAKPF